MCNKIHKSFNIKKLEMCNIIKVTEGGEKKKAHLCISLPNWAEQKQGGASDAFNVLEKKNAFKPNTSLFVWIQISCNLHFNIVDTKTRLLFEPKISRQWCLHCHRKKGVTSPPPSDIWSNITGTVYLWVKKVTFKTLVWNPSRFFKCIIVTVFMETFKRYKFERLV